MIGPLLFTVGFIVQGLFRHDEYDPIAETVSALEAGPNGWIQQLNFFVFGILMMIYAPIAICRLNTQRDPSSGQPYTAARCRFVRMSCTVSSGVWLLESSQ